MSHDSTLCGFFHTPVEQATSTRTLSRDDGEFERELIIARTGEGRTRAKDRGVKFGRPRALTPHQRREAMRRLANGEAQADVARSFNVSQATISRLAAPSPFEESVVAA
jgi:DNA invertase Pin-like site-specific DNA recombinase